MKSNSNSWISKLKRFSNLILSVLIFSSSPQSNIPFFCPTENILFICFLFASSIHLLLFLFSFLWNNSFWNCQFAWTVSWSTTRRISPFPLTSLHLRILVLNFRGFCHPWRTLCNCKTRDFAAVSITNSPTTSTSSLGHTIDNRRALLCSVVF